MEMTEKFVLPDVVETWVNNDSLDVGLSLLLLLLDFVTFELLGLGFGVIVLVLRRLPFVILVLKSRNSIFTFRLSLYTHIFSCITVKLIRIFHIEQKIQPTEKSSWY
jgi:hypothetical protein